MVELEDLLASLSLVDVDPSLDGPLGPEETLRTTGLNLQVVNGSA